MPGLNEVWALVFVDPRGLIAILAVLLGAGLMGRLLAGRLASLPLHSSLERGLVWLLVGLTAFSWVGVVLAALRLFRWWAVVVALLALALAARRGLASDSQAGPGSRVPQTPRLALVALLALLLGALWLFARPAESYFLIDDSAVYTLGGVVLARDGRLFADASAVIPATPDFAHSFFVRNLSGTISRFYGPFYQYFLGAKELEIGFLPLPKIWAALMVWLLGPALATWATPIFGVVGVASLYGLTRRAYGWPAGLIAALLLTINLPQVWFARYPISEMAAQATMLGSLYLAALARAPHLPPQLARRIAVFSGATLALWSVIRLESVALIPLFAVLLLVAWGRSTWAAGGYARSWAAALALLSIIGWGISLIVSRHYLFDQSLGLLGPRAGSYAVGVLLMLAFGVVILRRPLDALLKSRPELIPRWLWVTVGIVWTGWAVLCLALLVRGRFANSVPEWLTYYLSPLGPALALGGVACAVWIGLREAPSPGDAASATEREHAAGMGLDVRRSEVMSLLMVAGLLLAAYSLNPLVSRWQPWAVRRLAPIILPALALSSAVLLARLLRLRGHVRNNALAWIGAALAGVLLLTQVALQARPLVPFVAHRELEGFAAEIEAIAQKLPPGAVLLFDDGPTGGGLPQVFELWFGHPSLALTETPQGAAAAALDSLVEKARAEGRRIFFVATDGALDWFPAKWDFVEYGSWQVTTTVVRPPNGRSPQSDDIVDRSYIMDFYEILPAGSDVASASLRVEAGEGSYPYLREGFHGWDLGATGAIARWTDGRGEIVLPWPSANHGQPTDLCLRISLAGGRPADAAPATLAVQAEGIEVFREALPKDFAPREITIVARQLRNTGLDGLELELVSPTWKASATGDNRDLGVLFYGLDVAPAEECAQ